MLKGRLGLETARVPYADRHGLLYLARGRLYVEDGTLHFSTLGWDGGLKLGDYDIPFQMISCILLGPGGAVTHDALRLLARHGTGLIAVGEDSVRFYASMPGGADASALARRQVSAWADASGQRIKVARRLYAWRLGEVLPHSEIAVLRGIEGQRMKESYSLMAARYGIKWEGRKYDRSNPGATDTANQAINHAATGVEAAAMVAVAATSTIPQLGFIHEDSANAFPLDIADLYRTSITLQAAFQATRDVEQKKTDDIERATRRVLGRLMREKNLIPDMIDKIKTLFQEEGPAHGGGGDA